MAESSLSSQIENIDPNLLEHERIRAIKELLLNAERVDKKSVKFINNMIKGRYGSEYLIHRQGYTETIDFYEWASSHFPHVIEFRLALADTVLISGNNERALKTFLECFKVSPNLVFSAPGELAEIFLTYGDEKDKISFGIALYYAYIEEEEYEEAELQLQSLINKFDSEEIVAMDPSLKEFCGRTIL